MNDLKFYSIGWIIIHLFLAGFMSIIYFLAGVRFDFSGVIRCILVLLSIEVLIIGLAVGMYKLFTHDECR